MMKEKVNLHYKIYSDFVLIIARKWKYCLHYSYRFPDSIDFQGYYPWNKFLEISKSRFGCHHLANRNLNKFYQSSQIRCPFYQSSQEDLAQLVFSL